jgi:hypothetical protein
LGELLQHIDPAKAKERTDDQLPPVVTGTSGNFAMDVVTETFGGFMGNIADDSTPTDLEGPDDLNDLVTDFFQNLPLVKVFLLPLQMLLSFIFGGDPEDWEDETDVEAGFTSWLGNIPILGDLLEMFEGTFSGGGVGGAIADYFSGERDKVDAVAGSVSSVTSTAVTTGIISGYTWARYVFTSNGTFTTPTPPAGKKIAKITSACINGGNGGRTAAKNDRGGEGGVGGGYQYREHTAASVGASQAVTVGAGASANNTGGASSFGSLNSGVRDTGAVWTSQGALETANKPGAGGQGGSSGADGDVPFTGGYRGVSSALATGGAGGAKAASGSVGGTVATDTFQYSGGAGGGGGGGNGGGSGSAGGAGSAPGGGGGGGGSCGSNVLNTAGAGGAGANGAVVIWVYYEDDI